MFRSFELRCPEQNDEMGSVSGPVQIGLAADASDRPVRYRHLVGSSIGSEATWNSRIGRVWRLIGGYAVPLLFVGLIVATYIEPSIAGDQDNPAIRPIDVWWLLAGLAGANALAIRRTYPLVAFGVVTIAITVIAVGPYPLPPSAWMIYVAAFSLGRSGKGREAPIALLWFTGSVALSWFSDQGLTGVDVAFVYAFGVMAWMAGRELRRWHERVGVEIAAADRRVELERQGVELALTQERLHIAREIHDVVAHSLGVISVQAGVAGAAFERRPDEAKRAVQNIATTSRSSLSEIRRILGTLRDGSDQECGYVPRPTLTDLPRLIAGVEANGVAVEANIDLADNVPAGIEASAYRIVQQALTNVLEHAAASKVRLRVCCRDDDVDIEVHDDGRGETNRSTGGGYGLVGMRERVATYGGRLSAGPHALGGFRVRATIPYQQGEAIEREPW